MTVATEVRSFERVFIGGRWVEPSGDGTLDVISPITEEKLATIPETTTSDIDAAVAAARRAFDDGPWPRMSPSERAEALQRVAAEIEARLPAMEASFTEEIGAPVAVSQAFHGNATAMWADAATLHERVPFEERRTWDGGEAVIVREPVGVVATVIPWNGPVATASLKISPALAAGCTVVLKPAPEGPVSTLLLAEALEAAELPEGVISVLPASREVGEHLVRHRGHRQGLVHGLDRGRPARRCRCAASGSRASRSNWAASRPGSSATTSPLEDVLGTLAARGLRALGPGLRGDHADLRARARATTTSIEAAAEVLRSRCRSATPRDPGTAIGPLAAERQRDRVEGYIAQGQGRRARRLRHGRRPPRAPRQAASTSSRPCSPTSTNDMTIAREEIFGPVLTVIPYEDEDDAVRMANDSDYGLSGAVYTNDLERGEAIARRVRTGQIYVNNASMCVVQPFGGFKQSGLGREGGVEGIAPYFETKMIQGI